MESQGHGKRAVELADTKLNVRKRRPRCNMRRYLSSAFLLCLALTSLDVAFATSYVYDAYGRVVAVTQSSGTTTQYTYDAMGNIVQVSGLSAGQLAIFATIPTHGVVGTQVTIEGQGFSSSPSSNTVSFNGTVASVISATSNQLITSVPLGATTGPVSVTVGSQTATSVGPFVVGDVGTSPVITQVSPTIVASGSTVIVTGEGLNPVSGDTVVYLANNPQSLTSISDSQFQFNVTSTASSGHVAVQTPYGEAISPAPLLVVPSGITLANVVSSAVATVNGAPVNLAMSAAGETGAVLFDATGGWFSIQASAITPSASSISYSIYGPGNVLISQGTISASSPSIHLPQLAQSGTYTAFFTPSNSAANITLNVVSDATVSSAATTVTTTVPGQSTRLLFSAVAGQTLDFDVLSSSTSPANNSILYALYTPTGASYSSQYLQTGSINLPNLLTSGLYQVVIAPGSGTTGSTQVKVAPTSISPLVPNGSLLSAASNLAGENVYLSFTANQGQNLELTLNSLSITGSGSTYAQVSVSNTTGTNVASFTCYTTNPNASCMHQLRNLTAGTYNIVVTPPSAVSTVSFNALLEDDVAGPALTLGSTTSASVGVGQEERFTFNANQGDTVALNLTGVTTSPANNAVMVSIYRPDVGIISNNTNVYAAFSSSGTQVMNLSNLPIAGTYTVIVSPLYGLAASFQLGVSVGVTGGLTSGGAAANYASQLSGENVYLTFNANGGDNLELTLNKVAVTGHLTVYVYNSQGVQVTSFSCYPTNPAASCTQHLWDLAAGAYSVVAVPASGGTMSFSALLEPDVVGAALNVGTGVSVTLSAGQVERFTFNANAYDNVVLSLTGVSTTPAGNSATMLIYAPATEVGSITSTTSPFNTYTTSSSTTTNQLTMPVTGTYTVIVAPIDGLPLNATLKEVSDTSGTGPTWPGTNLPTNGTATNFSNSGSGQSVTMTFNVTSPGEALDLTLSNLVMTGSNNNVQLTVTNTSGTTVSQNWCYTTTNPSCITPLWNLPVGSYTITASPGGAATESFTAMLGPVTVGPAIAINSPATVTLATGQAEQVTFNANAGDSVSLAVSVTSVAIANMGVQAYVFRPDTGAISTSNNYAVMATPGSSPNSYTLNLPDLPVGGAYRVVLLGGMGTAFTAQVEALDQPEGSLSANAAAQSFSSSVAGQNVYFAFSATQGENAELELSNVNITGSSTDYVIANVTNESGVNVASITCYTGSPPYTGSLASCTQPLWNLVAGLYTVTVAPPSVNATISFNAQIQNDVIGSPLQANTATTMTLTSGQVERLTFNANAGQPVAFMLSGVTTSPSNGTVYVSIYQPGGGDIATGNAYAQLNASSNTLLNLTYLPASGTYTVVAYANCAAACPSGYTYSGMPATAQLTLQMPSVQVLPTTGVAQSYATTSNGQFVDMSFTATQGQDLLLSFTNVVITENSNEAIQISVVSSGGNVVAKNTCVPNYQNCMLDLPNLQAGTYQILVSPPDSSTTISFSASLQPMSSG